MLIILTRGVIPNEVSRLTYPLTPTCSPKKLIIFPWNGLNPSSRIPILLRVDKYSKLVELPWSTRTFLTRKLAAATETTIGSSRFWSIPLKSSSMKEMTGSQAIVFWLPFNIVYWHYCSEVSLFGRAQVSSDRKPPGNGVNDFGYLIIWGHFFVYPPLPLRATISSSIWVALWRSSPICSVGVLADVAFSNQALDLVL